MPNEKDELTLQEAASIFDIDSGELGLALNALEEHRRGLYSNGIFRGVRTTRWAGNFPTYHRGDCEAAIALLAAKRLGYDPDAPGSA